ncbi:hypothetical protein ACFOKI_02820 [Sphingomonas qilianensis]|uniref:Secreted protein n=1 Tax=Sphingomonas qilianensis TaxID=1736690 RepID=A0ABU9XVK6_9SPHN
MPVSILLFLTAAAVPAVAPPSAQMRLAIKAKLSDQLLDGASARFRWPKADRNNVAYCGFVNAKNSYGAYIGFRPFYTLGFHVKGANGVSKYSIVKAEVAGADDGAPSVVAQFCAKAGFDLSSMPAGGA